MAKFQQKSWRAFPARTAHNSVLTVRAWKVGDVAGDSSSPEGNVTQVPRIQGRVFSRQKKAAPLLLAASQNVTSPFYL